MPRIVSVGTAVPPYEVPQKQAQQFARDMFSGVFPDIERLLRVFDHAHIEKRHFSVPFDWFQEHHPFQDKNETYIEVACELAVQAIEACLHRARISAWEIDHLFFVSTTGIATPSIDALIANRLSVSPHMKRTPIWGLGCAGGAVGLARAYEYARAFPHSRVLLVTVELCSLTFQRNDLSKSNLIATSLFGDGAACALVCGENVIIDTIDNPTPHILATRSTLWKKTENVMGWKLADDGLNVVFSKDIPTIVKTWMRPNMVQFLAGEKLALDDIDHFVIHPGGMKVILAYEEALGLSSKKTTATRNVLAEFGNMSSATVLFVLQKVMDRKPQAGQYGILTALGPGFSSEQLLLRW